MRIAADHGVPRPLGRFLAPHTVIFARDRGWERLSNGELLATVEHEGFDVLLTTDKQIRYQQNLSKRNIALVVLGTTQWPVIRLHTAAIVERLNSCTAGSYVEIDLPVLPPDVHSGDR